MMVLQAQDWLEESQDRLTDITIGKFGAKFCIINNNYNKGENT